MTAIHPLNKTANSDPQFYTTLALLSLLAILPIWLVRLPPLIDLPQHAALAHALINLQDYKDTYEIQWATPYMGFLSLSSALSLLFGVLVGTKLAITLIILALPIALIGYLNEVKGDKWLALLGLPFSYGYAGQWGFATYMLSIPLSIFFLTAVLKQTKKPSHKANTIVCLLSIALFFSHPITFGTCMAIAAVLILNESPKNDILPKALTLGKPYIPACLITTAWLIIKPKSEGRFETIWAEDLIVWIGRIPDFFTWGLSSDLGTQTLQHPSLVIIALCLCTLTFFRPEDATHRQLIPFITALIIFLASPNSFLGLDGLAPRQTTLILCLFLGIAPASKLKKDWANQTRIFLLITLTTYSLTLPLTNFLEFKKESEDIYQLLQKIPEKQTVVKLQNGQESWNTQHIITWYQALKGGYTLKEFTWLHHMPIRRKTQRVTQMKEIPWEDHTANYYIYKNPAAAINNDNFTKIEKIKKRKLVLLPLQQKGDWILAKEKKPCESKEK